MDGVQALDKAVAILRKMKNEEGFNADACAAAGNADGFRGARVRQQAMREALVAIQNLRDGVLLAAYDGEA